MDSLKGLWIEFTASRNDHVLSSPIVSSLHFMNEGALPPTHSRKYVPLADGVMGKSNVELAS